MDEQYMDDRYLWQYVLQVNPFARREDVIEITELNEWDLLIVFRDGRKILYDRYTRYYKNIAYKNTNELSPEQEKMEFAYMLRSLMGRYRISQEEMAERANTSQTMISHYMTGRSIPSAIMLNKIAKILGCSMDDFFNKNY